MKTNINLTEQSEDKLKTLKKIAAINNLNDTKEDLINLSINMAFNVVINSDEETLLSLTNLKKTI